MHLVIDLEPAPETIALTAGQDLVIYSPTTGMLILSGFFDANGDPTPSTLTTAAGAPLTSQTFLDRIGHQAQPCETYDPAIMLGFVPFTGGGLLDGVFGPDLSSRGGQCTLHCSLDYESDAPAVAASNDNAVPLTLVHPNASADLPERAGHAQPDSATKPAGATTRPCQSSFSAKPTLAPDPQRAELLPLMAPAIQLALSDDIGDSTFIQALHASFVS